MLVMMMFVADEEVEPGLTMNTYGVAAYGYKWIMKSEAITELYSIGICGARVGCGVSSSANVEYGACR